MIDSRPVTRRSRRAPLLLLATVLALLASMLPSAGAATPTESTAVTDAPKPTIVLVHGAFADSSGWNGVIKRLGDEGYTTYAFSNPLRSMSADAEYLRLFLSTISGPIVLVGHSYGGAVITNAATGNRQVKALVYVAGYAPDEGETLLAVNELGGGHSEVGEHLVIRPYPGAPADDGDGYIDPAWFKRLFAQDLSRDRAATMAAGQRPAALSILRTESGDPAWKSIPTSYVVATRDRIIPTEAQRVMAERADATTVEIDSSHVVMMSHPDEVTEVVLDAATSVS